MAKLGKKYTVAGKDIKEGVKYPFAEAIDKVVKTAYAKFDESVDIAIRLGVDPKQADQMVRGTVVLPHGTGKKIRVIVFAKGEKEKEGLDAGADVAGSDDLIAKISGGWLDFDCAIATPDMMSAVGKIAKILGPRGLMPNPKVGTVTMDVARAVKDIKAGRVEFRVDKTSNVHVQIGKVSFGPEKLKENAHTVIDAIQRAKPQTSKGIYLKGISVSSTMGHGIRVDVSSL